MHLQAFLINGKAIIPTPGGSCHYATSIFSCLRSLITSETPSHQDSPRLRKCVIYLSTYLSPRFRAIPSLNQLSRRQSHALHFCMPRSRMQGRSHECKALYCLSLFPLLTSHRFPNQVLGGTFAQVMFWMVGGNSGIGYIMEKGERSIGLRWRNLLMLRARGE